MKKTIMVKVKPGSKKREVFQRDNELHARITAPPQKGKANEELIELLSQYFGIPESRITIKRGHTSRIKIIEIDMV